MGITQQTQSSLTCRYNANVSIRQRSATHRTTISGLITVVSQLTEYTLLEDMPSALTCEHGESRPTVLSLQEAGASWCDV